MTLASLAGLATALGGPILTLEGGGFRAQSVDAGFMAGMLAFAGREKSQARPTFESTGLFKRFAAVSTNSGSSWFFSELAYSASFKALIEEMAAKPDKAAEAYRASWTSKWLAATNVTDSKFNLLGDLAHLLVKELLGTGDEDSIYMVRYFLATGFTWDHFVDVLLNSTSAVPPTRPLGAPPSGAWADRLVWLVDHSVVTPPLGREARLFQAKLGYPRVSYRAQAPPLRAPPPLYTPAAFSATLGGGLDADAPFRYVAAAAAEAVADLSYVGVVVPVLDSDKAKSAALGPDLAKRGVTQHVGRLPISRVAAASSAFLGGACVAGGAVAEVEALAGADVAPWASSAPDGRTFATANALVAKLKRLGGVDEETVGQLAGAAVHGLIDGVYTDGTGAANAVATGATELTLLLNSISNTSAASASASALVKLFPGAPPPAAKRAAPSLAQVFASPLAAEVLAELSGFKRLALPAGSRYLTEVAVGSFAATTAANRHYGVAAGRTVRVHVVSIGSSLDIGEFENLAHYDLLAQEIAIAIAAQANAATVRAVLLPMMLGAPAEVEARGRMT